MDWNLYVPQTGGCEHGAQSGGCVRVHTARVQQPSPSCPYCQGSAAITMRQVYAGNYDSHWDWVDHSIRAISHGIGPLATALRAERKFGIKMEVTISVRMGVWGKGTWCGLDRAKLTHLGDRNCNRNRNPNPNPNPSPTLTLLELGYRTLAISSFCLGVRFRVRVRSFVGGA